MDTGQSFTKKSLSRVPIERIQKIQQEIQANIKKGNLIHLVGRNDRVFSQLIPGALMAIALPLTGPPQSIENLNLVPHDGVSHKESQKQ